MEIHTSIRGINFCYCDKQIAHHFNSFNYSIPITRIFTVCDNELIDCKVFVGTMPIHVRIFVKEVSDCVLILSQHSLNKTAYIHNHLPPSNSGLPPSVYHAFSLWKRFRIEEALFFCSKPPPPNKTLAFFAPSVILKEKGVLTHLFGRYPV